MEKHVAIVLSAGKGSRMKSDIPKQYIRINGRPLICYTIEAFENSFIDEIVVVVGKGEVETFQNYILKDEKFQKITKIVEGGKERYDSVYNGLQAIEKASYVYIHDGARPFVTEELLLRGKESVIKNGTAIAAVKAKDTIKVVGKDGMITDTPDRNTLWQVQTPQIFAFADIKEAYEKMQNDLRRQNITDDAMVMETYGNKTVYIYEGDYHNIKVTTPDDLETVRVFIDNK